ncbi:MAG: hypothetical protein KOO62_01020 [candidate division Zixibacteria bacterium]|nr:hypothetical protein [candidate division Zixibacteria bacterium]
MIRNGRLISIIILAAVVMLAWPGANAVADETVSSPERNSEKQIDAWPDHDCYLAQVDESTSPVQNHKPRQRRKHIEQLRLLKLLELLDLSPDQETQFIVAFRQFRKGLRGIHRARVEIIDQLATGLKDNSLAPKNIYEFIANLEKLAVERRIQDKTFIEKARELLDARQLGKLVIFQERFEQALIEDVKAFHDRPSRGGHGGW